MPQKLRPQAEMLSGSPQPNFTGYQNAPIIAKRNPTTSDTGYNLGQVWINKLTGTAFQLTQVSSGSASWQESAGTGGYPVSPYVVGPIGQAGYQTIQSALNAANVAGSGTVYVQPGTYTENLTLYPNINIEGSLGSAVIIGVHTPPTTGTITLDYLIFISPTDILNSSAAGTCSININNAFVLVGNGYIFNLPNWTGELLMDNCGEASTTDGVVNNTAGCQIKFINVEIGSTTGTMILTGNANVRFDTCNINCAVNIAGSGNFIFQNGVVFRNTVTIGGTKTGSILDAVFLTDANIALIYNSSGLCTISEVTIDSSSNPVISGAGTINFGHLAFRNASNIAGTITVQTPGVSMGGETRAGADIGGFAAFTSLTNTNSTTIGAGTGTVKMSSGNNSNNGAWIKIYVGTTAYWIPAWTTNSP